ncbi:MAG: L,D-transpeptidase family protein [Planctomycetes bacterium]|nr:L,D-transpeptidase family protein [Planctomycetota bacterium]
MKTLVFILILALGGGFYYYEFVKAPQNQTQTDSEQNQQSSLGQNPAVVTQTPVKPKPQSESKVGVEQLLSQGYYDKALALLQKVPEDKRNRTYALNLSHALDGAGKKDEALAVLDKLLKISSHNLKVETLWAKAEMLENNGQKEASGEVYYEIFQSYSSSQEYRLAAYKLKDLWKSWLSDSSKDSRMMDYNKVLCAILENSLDEGVNEDCYKLLNRINSKLFFSSKAIDGLVVFHTIKYGESLASIGKMHNVPPARIARVNNLKNPNAIRSGQTLRVIKGRVKLHINKETFIMHMFIGDLFYKRFLVGTGKDGRTPSVSTRVSRSMAKNPDYTDPITGDLILAGDKRNPIGTRWIGLEIGQGYGIHGTVQPDSVGKQMSKGCIRMRNHEVEELYDYMMFGDEVIIE